MRKLVTIRKIEALNPIPDADAIEVATIDGWKLVVKRGEFNVGDYCVYFEIDAFLPEADTRYTFLMKSGVREFEGVRGHKLRTIKLRGQTSQGLALPIKLFPEIAEFTNVSNRPYPVWIFADPTDLENWVYADNEQSLKQIREFDYSELLGIKKWEPTIPANMAGQVAGMFPGFIRKTDQERCQNMLAEIFGYDDTYEDFDVGAIPQEGLDRMVQKGDLIVKDGKYMKVNKATADRDARFEVTMKLDGSSVTFYHTDGQIGVCSRNLELKINDENKDNTLVRMLIDSELNEALPHLGNIAIQGELMGEGIQKNQEKIKGHKYFIFDVQNTDSGEYYTPQQRMQLMKKLRELGVKDMVQHVPVIHESTTLQEMGINNVEDMLNAADGPSFNPQVKREGIVFKRVDGKFSFKAISNSWLMKNQ